MAVILEATNCPPVQVFTNSVMRNSAMDTTALVGPNIPGTTTWRKEANQNVAVGDETARYGAGLIGVPDGPTKITISTAVGLLLPVTKGHAMIGGPVEIASTTTLAVPDNESRVWIWLQQTGAALTYKTDLTAPSGECCLIGSCVTSNGNIVSVDYSGVMYLRGGIGVRQTADTGPPADTPSSKMTFIASTLGGFYFWSGTDYLPFAGAQAVISEADTVADLVDRADDTERKFRQLLFILTELIGNEVLYTRELQDDFELASAEV